MQSADSALVEKGGTPSRFPTTIMVDSSSSVLGAHYKSSLSSLIGSICSLCEDVRANKRNCTEIGRVMMMLYPIIRDIKFSDLMDDAHARICIHNLQKAVVNAEALLKKCVFSGPFTWLVHSTRIARRLADISTEISHSLQVVQMVVAESNRKQLRKLREELLNVKLIVREEDWAMSEKVMDSLLHNLEDEDEGDDSGEETETDHHQDDIEEPIAASCSWGWTNDRSDEKKDSHSETFAATTMAATSQRSSPTAGAKGETTTPPPHSLSPLAANHTGTGNLRTSEASGDRNLWLEEEPPPSWRLNAAAAGQQDTQQQCVTAVGDKADLMSEINFEAGTDMACLMRPAGKSRSDTVKNAKSKSKGHRTRREVLREVAEHLHVPERDVWRELAEVEREMTEMGVLRNLSIDPSSLELVQLIGSGGGKSTGVWVGRLWEKGEKGTDEGFFLSCEVAVKRFPCFEGVQISQEYKREVEILHRASSRCDNVCKLYGVCEKGGHLCIVMKLYKHSIQDIIKRVNGPMSMVDVERYAIDMCKALMQLHREHIIVQDVKPANFLEDEEGNVVLADFGISKVVERTTAKYSPTVIRGTSRFMSPEAWSGVALWMQSDIWSLGCTILNMITGDVPFAGVRDSVVAFKVLHQEAKPEIPAGVPNPLRNVLLRCFEYNAFDRPQAHELLAFFLRGCSLEDAPLQTPLTDVFIERTPSPVKDSRASSGTSHLAADASDTSGNTRGGGSKGSSGSGARLTKLSDIMKKDVHMVGIEAQKNPSHSSLTECEMSSEKRASLLKPGAQRSGPCCDTCTRLHGSSSMHRHHWASFPWSKDSYCLWGCLVALVLIALCFSIAIPFAFVKSMKRPAVQLIVPRDFSRTEIDSTAWYGFGRTDDERYLVLMAAVRRTLYETRGVPCLGFVFNNRLNNSRLNTTFAYMCTFFGGPLSMSECQYLYPNSSEIVTNDYRLGEAILATHGPSSRHHILAGQQELFIGVVMKAIQSVMVANQSFQDTIRSRLEALNPAIVLIPEQCPKDSEGVRLPWRRNVTHSTTIHVGQAVTWYWDDDEPHSIKATNEQFTQEIHTAMGAGELAVSRVDECNMQNANFSASGGPPIPCTLTPGSFLYSQLFSSPGTYTYTCSRFPNDMRGTVTVI